MFRFIITFGYLFLYLTLTAPVILTERLICRILGKRPSDVWAWKNIRHLFGACHLLSGCHITYKGSEKLPKDTPLYYVGNHSSYFDIIFSFNGFSGPTGYVAKKELDRFSLGVWMRQISCVFIDRKDPKSAVEMVKSCVDNLNRGVSMCIFPEGTRSKDPDNIKEFHNGSFKPAIRAGKPIIPMAITGTRDVWENHFPTVKATNVIIEFGDPIYPGELSKEELKSIGEIVRSRVVAMYSANRSVLYPGKAPLDISVTNDNGDNNAAGNSESNES